MTVPVRDWPTYLLRDMPVPLLREIEADARKFQSSRNEVIRQILCRTYRVRCVPVDNQRWTSQEAGAATMVLKLQPALHRKLTARRNGKTARALILDALEAHYREEPSD